MFDEEHNVLYFGGRKSLKHIDDYNTYMVVGTEGRCFQDKGRWRSMRLNDVLKVADNMEIMYFYHLEGVSFSCLVLDHHRIYLHQVHKIQF